MIDLESELASILEEWNLLEHPFYKAWSAGTLPKESLQAYAQEYGAFVNTIPVGWGALGDTETAREEHEHARLWDSFAAALGTHVAAPQGAETRELVLKAEELFAEPVTALGALYAFEAQQPGTSSSKLDGLNLHYDMPAAAKTYFEVHADDDHEAVELLEQFAALSPEDLKRALAACETMAESLWNGLTGVCPEPLRAEMAV